jgi:hypothetical protein
LLFSIRKTGHWKVIRHRGRKYFPIRIGVSAERIIPLGPVNNAGLNAILDIRKRIVARDPRRARILLDSSLFWSVLIVPSHPLVGSRDSQDIRKARPRWSGCRGCRRDRGDRAYRRLSLLSSLVGKPQIETGPRKA